MEPLTITLIGIATTIGWFAIGAASSKTYVRMADPDLRDLSFVIGTIGWPVTLGLVIGLAVARMGQDPRDGDLDDSDFNSATNEE